MRRKILILVTFLLGLVAGLGITLALWRGPATASADAGSMVVLCSRCTYPGLQGEGRLVLMNSNNGEVWVYSDAAMAGMGEPIDWGTLILGHPVVRSDSPLGNEATAVGSMRTLNIALITYASTYPNGYARSLAQLGGGGAATADHGGLIDDQLASGLKHGYRFTYKPGPLSTEGRIDSYTIVARPVEYGTKGFKSFFADQSGVIRESSGRRDATVNDPPLVY